MRRIASILGVLLCGTAVQAQELTAKDLAVAGPSKSKGDIVVTIAVTALGDAALAQVGRLDISAHLHLSAALGVTNLAYAHPRWFGGSLTYRLR